MRTRYPLIVCLATVWAVSAPLSERAWRVANARATIHLLTGASGTPCASDPKVTFTSNSVLSPQPAITWAPIGWWAASSPRAA